MLLHTLYLVFYFAAYAIDSNKSVCFPGFFARFVNFLSTSEKLARETARTIRKEYETADERGWTQIFER